MPPEEVVHRLREAYFLHLPVPAQASCSLRGQRVADGSHRLVDIWRSIWSEEVAAECKISASMAVSGTTRVLGHDWSTAEKQWNNDPASSYVWPSSPAHKVDYRHSHGTDPKWTWEVNRLLFLIPVSFAIESNVIEREAAEEFIAGTLLDWIRQCDVGRGPQWASSIEVAIRSISMTLALQAISNPDEALIEAISKSISQHAAWIKRFPSAYSSANNHRVAELAALLLLDASWVGVLEPDKASGLESELLDVCRKLFANDGIGLEQSPTYGAFSMEFLALALQCREWSDNESRVQAMEVLSQASSALAELINEDGTLLRYGDDDEGKIVTVAVPESKYAESIVRLATGSTGRRSSGIITFAEGGLSILRYKDYGNETTWLFDHGPLGFGELSAHGHADVLSVSLRSAGLDWIVDAGTYRYHGDKKWRTYFRSSRAHNAPQIAQLDSSVMTGDFNWHPHKRAQGRLVSAKANESCFYIEATHDGYEQQGMGRVFRKLERLAEGRYRVTDSYGGNEQLSTGFIINPDCFVEKTSSGWKISSPVSNVIVEVAVFGQAATHLEVPQDETAWFSPRFGVKRAAWRATAAAGVNGPESQRLIFDFTLSISPNLEAQQ